MDGKTGYSRPRIFASPSQSFVGIYAKYNVPREESLWFARFSELLFRSSSIGESKEKGASLWILFAISPEKNVILFFFLRAASPRRESNVHLIYFTIADAIVLAIVVSFD